MRLFDRSDCLVRRAVSESNDEGLALPTNEGESLLHGGGRF